MIERLEPPAVVGGASGCERLCLAVWMCLLTGGVARASGDTGLTLAASDGYLTQLTGALALVAVMILALGWMLRRLPGAVGRGARLIRILAVHPLGARERLILVQVGEEQILIGASPAGLHCLHRLARPIEPPQTPETALGANFASLLSGYLKKSPDA